MGTDCGDPAVPPPVPSDRYKTGFDLNQLLDDSRQAITVTEPGSLEDLAEIDSMCGSLLSLGERPDITTPLRAWL
jgi:hypothetical protein